MKKAIYVRWSTDDQSHGTTLETQLTGCRHYALSQDWIVDEDMVFIDDGYSGGTLDRPAMTRLRSLVAEGQIDTVIVLKLDRLSRSVIDTVNLVMDEWAEKCNVRAAREPIDTSSAMGRQFFYILASFAEWERSVIRERMQSGKMARAREGKNPGFIPCYGYGVGKTGEIVINHDEAVIVKRIFSDYLSGMGSTAIAHKLNNDGIPARTGRGWNSTGVLYMLKNKAYMGVFSFKDVSINNAIEAIISEHDFKIVQEELVRRKLIPGRAVSSLNLLTGLIKCQCGSSIKARAYPGRTKGFYVCNRKEKKGKTYCDCGNIRQDELDDAIIGAVKDRFLKGRIEVEGLIKERFETKKVELESAAKMAKEELLKAEAQEKRADDDYIRGDLEATDYRRIINGIRIKIDRLTASMNEAQAQLEAIQAPTIPAQEFATMLEAWDSIPTERQKAVLRCWIDNIVAYRNPDSKDFEVEIQYNWI